MGMSMSGCLPVTCDGIYRMYRESWRQFSSGNYLSRADVTGFATEGGDGKLPQFTPTAVGYVDGLLHSVALLRWSEIYYLRDGMHGVRHPPQFIGLQGASQIKFTHIPATTEGTKRYEVQIFTNFQAVQFSVRY